MNSRRTQSRANSAIFFAIILFTFGTSSAQELDWLAGPWQVEYTDEVLGKIVGVADIRIAGTTMSAGSVLTGSVALFGPDLKRYELDVAYFRVKDGRVQIHLNGEGPPSGVEALNEYVRDDVETIPGQVGDVVRATWGEVRQNASVVAGIEQDLYVEFPIPDDGEAEILSGKWHYSPGMISQIPGNRGGKIEYDSIRVDVSGRERWTRPAAHVSAVVAEGDGRIDTLSPPNSAITSPFWISVGGFGLPVQPKREAVIRSGSGNLMAHGAWQLHPDDPESIQFLAAVNRNMPQDPVPVTVNGTQAYWLPVMPGVEPTSIRIVRQYSETEFFAVTEAYAGDQIFIEAEYAEPQFTDILRFGILTDDLYPIVAQSDAAADSESDTEWSLQRHLNTVTATTQDEVAERTEIKLRRTSNPAVYRSSALMIKPADTRDLPRYVDLSERTEQSITARSEIDELLVWEVDPIAHTGAKKIVTVPVIKRPDTTLWPDALHTAQQCRANGRSKTEYWNIDYANAVFEVARSVPGAGVIPDPRGTRDVVLTEEISLDDHAAAILLRRVLQEKVEQQRAYYRSPDEISDAEIDRMIYLGFRRDFHPLFPFEVDVPGNNAYAQNYAGFKWPLRMLFQRHVFELTFKEDEEAYREFLKLAVANAAGQALDATDRAMQHTAAADDCDVLKLLMISGRSMSGLVDIVRPLLIKENPDPQGVPRFVQDREALRAVTGVATKQASIDGIEALSNASLDVVLLAATLGATTGEIMLAKAGTHALTAMRAARLAGATLDLIDDVRLYQQSANLKVANEETELARGIIGIVGDTRYVKAVESETAAFWGAVTGLSLRFMTISLSTPANFINNWKYKYRGMSLLVRPETTSLIVHKAAMEGLDSLNRFDRAFLNTLARKLPEDAARFTDLDRAIASLYGRGNLPNSTMPDSAPQTAGGAAQGVASEARRQQLSRELGRMGMTQEEIDTVLSAAVRDADVVGAESGAALASIRQADSADGPTTNALSDQQASEALAQLHAHNEATAAVQADAAVSTPTPTPPAELQAQLEALGYRPQEAAALVAQRTDAQGQMSANESAIRIALDGGRSPEELLKQGYSAPEILAELDFQRAQLRSQRLAAELEEIDQRQLPLPDLTEPTGASVNAETVASLRAQGRSDDEIADVMVDSFIRDLDGPPSFANLNDWLEAMARSFGDDFKPSWLEDYMPRFMNPRGGLAQAAADATVPAGAVAPSGRTFVSIYADGERIDIPVGPLIGRGAFNEVYQHPTNPRYVIRVNYNPRSRALDALGADILRGSYGLDDGGMLRGPRRRMSLTSECDENFQSFADDLNDWHGLTGSDAFRHEELTNIFARRNSVEYIEVARGQMAGSFAGWLDGSLTNGQALEVYRNLRRLNENGYVLLDSHGGNLHFEPVPGMPDEWRLHIIDSGSVVRVRGNTPAERAARATEMQQRVTAPQGAIADELYAATNHERRFALERRVGEDVRDVVYEGLDDATRQALGSAEQLVFVPQLARFPKVRDLLLMTEAERASSLPPGSLELVR